MLLHKVLSAPSFGRCCKQLFGSAFFLIIITKVRKTYSKKINQKVFDHIDKKPRKGLVKQQDLKMIKSNIESSRACTKKRLSQIKTYNKYLIQLDALPPFDDLHTL